MGDNIFSSGMEILAIIALVIVVIVTFAILVLPVMLQVFNENIWIFGIGILIFMLIFLGLFVVFMKNLGKGIL